MRRWSVYYRPWPAALWRHGLRLLAGSGLALLLAAGCSVPQPVAVVSGTGTLIVAVDGFRSEQGTAIISLFGGASGFPDDVAASLATATVAIRAGRAAATFAGLPYGAYAVSVLHDEDGDGQMATGLFGAPREGFGFSGDPDYRFGPPGFAEVSFLLVEPQRELTIGMRYETSRRQHQDEGRASGARRPQD